MSTLPWLARPGTFQQQFPTVATAKGKIEEEGEVPDPIGKRTHYFSESSPESVIRCGNPRCKDGGLDLKPIISGMVASNQTDYHEQRHCPGKEKSRQTVVTTCGNWFDVSIQLTYKSDQTAT
jgi:hypothetical protein